uniref:Immunoglobulin V-set domain-containing protein n=1 Tax=Acanthochromis polyacanthus TaxID=80966 RepID=A0A3Q1EWJ2_9TELE
MTSIKPSGAYVFLCASVAEVDAVIVLTQTPAVHTVSAGQEAVLNIEKYYGNWVRWYKQVPGGAPQFVVGFRFSDTSLNFGFTSTHQSQSDYRLIISNVEEGDSAVYYLIHAMTKTSSLSMLTSAF